MRKLISNLILLTVLVLLPVSATAEPGSYLLGLGIGNSNFHLNQPGIVADFRPPLPVLVHLTIAQPLSVSTLRNDWTST